MGNPSPSKVPVIFDRISAGERISTSYVNIIRIYLSKSEYYFPKVVPSGDRAYLLMQLLPIPSPQGGVGLFVYENDFFFLFEASGV